MSKERVFEILLEFFKDEYLNDPLGVGEWFALGDEDVDAFLEAVEKLGVGA